MATAVRFQSAYPQPIPGCCAVHGENIPFGERYCWKCIESEKRPVSTHWRTGPYPKLDLPEPRILQKCPTCGVSFESAVSHQKYCSYACYVNSPGLNK